MSRAKLVVVVVAVGAMVSCGGNGGGGSKSEAWSSKADSLSYAVGVSLVQSLRELDTLISADVVCAAIQDVSHGGAKLSVEEAENIYLRYKNVTLRQRARAKSIEWLDKIAADSISAVKSSEGLLSIVRIKGDENRKPTESGDRVKIISRGFHANGAHIQTPTDTVDTKLEYLIKGVREGVKLIGKGGVVDLWIPAEMAYGADGNSNGIGSYEALYYNVELLEVTPAKMR